MISSPTRSHLGGSCGQAPGVKSCGLGQTMSGVIVAMRQTLLSCTSLARNGATTLGAILVSVVPAHAGDLSLRPALSALFDFNRQEIAVLTTAVARLGFSVLAAILLMRKRVRAARSKARLRSEIAGLHPQAARLPARL